MQSTPPTGLLEVPLKRFVLWAISRGVRFSRRVVMISRGFTLLLPVVIGALWSDGFTWLGAGLVALLAIAFLVDWNVSDESLSGMERELAQVRRDAQAQADEEFLRGRDQLHIFTDEVAEPILNFLRAKIAETKAARVSESKVESLRKDIIHGARTLLSGDDIYVRVNYYRLLRDSSGAWELRRQDLTGGNARSAFKYLAEDGTPSAEGRVAIDRILALKKTPCLDMEKDGPALGIDPAEERNYVSFISAPVGKESPPYGMISVNTTTPEHLTLQDVGLVASMADFMAVAEALSRESNPEVGSGESGTSHSGEHAGSEILEQLEVGEH